MSFHLGELFIITILSARYDYDVVKIIQANKISNIVHNGLLELHPPEVVIKTSCLRTSI